MTIYAESSAVLAWLFGEPAGMAAQQVLASANVVYASDLTVIECERALIRAEAWQRLERAGARRRLRQLRMTMTQWSLLRMDAGVVERARQPFPGEPIRTLDAIHLATCLAVVGYVPEVILVSLDGRIRTAGRALHLPVLPEVGN